MDTEEKNELLKQTIKKFIQNPSDADARQAYIDCFVAAYNRRPTQQEIDYLVNQPWKENV